MSPSEGAIMLHRVLDLALPTFHRYLIPRRAELQVPTQVGGDESDRNPGPRRIRPKPAPADFENHGLHRGLPVRVRRLRLKQPWGRMWVGRARR